jgi:hypothetical protein
MSFIWFLNGLSYLAVALIAFYICFSFSKKSGTIYKVGNVLGVNGIFYLLFAFLNFLWVFNFLKPTKEDFILMNFALTVVSSILILYVIYKITDNRNLVYLFVLFLTAIFAINFSLNSFFLFSMAISYLLIIIIFLDLIFFSNLYLKKAGFAGLSYAIISIFFLILVVLNFKSFDLPWFIPNILMFFVLYLIFLDIKNLGVIEKKALKKKKIVILNFINVFVKFFIFIISISAFILLSTVALHEFGHAMVAQYYGCEHTRAVIYDIILAPHTEIWCSYYYNNIILTLGGILATFVIALIFLLTGGNFTTRLSYLIFGFSLLISYGDLTDLGIPKSIIATIIFLSLIIIIIAIVKLSSFYLRQQEIFKEGIKKGVKKIYDGEVEVKKILKYKHNHYARHSDMYRNNTKIHMRKKFRHRQM